MGAKMMVLALAAAVAVPAMAADLEVGERFSARCVGVVDGATVVVLPDGGDEVTVGLYGVDAPGLDDRMGRKVRAHLRQLAKGETVEVVITGIDASGASARVTLAGDDLSRTLTQRGLVRPVGGDPELASLAESARELGCGLWAESAEASVS